MAVTGVTESYESLNDLQETDDGIRFSRIFSVATDSRGDGPLTVLAASEIPIVGSSYSFGSESAEGLVVLRRKVGKPKPGSRNWKVEVEYGPRPSGNANDLESKSIEPTQRTPRGRIGNRAVANDMYWAYKRDFAGGLVMVEVDGVMRPRRFAVLNAAKERYQPIPKQEDFYAVLTIQRNEPLGQDYAEIVNRFVGAQQSDVFWGTGPDTWRITGIEVEPKREVSPSGYVIWDYAQVTYTIEESYSWNLELLEWGWNYRNGAGALVPFKNSEGGYFQGLLTATGSPLNGTGVYVEDGPETVFTEFVRAKRLPFSPLGLPQSLAEMATL